MTTVCWSYRKANLIQNDTFARDSADFLVGISSPMPKKKRQRGRPSGSKNRSGAYMRSQRRRIEEEIIRRALGGSIAALKLAADRTSPRLRPQAAPVELHAAASLTLTEKAGAIVDATLSGQLPPDVGRDLLAGLGDLAKLKEVVELEARIEALEKGHGMTLPWERNEQKKERLPIRGRSRRRNGDAKGN